jgi:hypothetical protein
MKYACLLSLLLISFTHSGFAAVPNSDLILGIRDTTGSSPNDLVIDLGSVTAFQAGGSFATGSLTSVLDLSSAINTVFGSNSANLAWGIVGTNGKYPSARTLWGTQVANSSLLDGNSSALNVLPVKTATTQSMGAAAITTVYGLTTAGFGTPTVISVSDPSSWTEQGFTAATAFGSIVFGESFQFENSTIGNTASDLYQWTPSNKTPKPAAVYLGTFSINSSGILCYSIPEPSTYALIIGAAGLGLAVLRRRFTCLQ